jgi:hypothetical protein
VKYAFVRAPLSFPDAINCRGLTSLDGVLTASGLTEAQLERETTAAFALWQGVANIDFERTDTVETADILIGAASSPHRRRAHANVAYGSTGDAATRKISKALVCLDPAQPWKVGFGGNADAYDMRYTLAHEIGHAIGLDHPSPSGELMSFSYAETFRVLQPGDIAGAALLYGSREAAKLAHANLNGQAPSPVQVPPALDVRGE